MKWREFTRVFMGCSLMSLGSCTEPAEVTTTEAAPRCAAQASQRIAIAPGIAVVDDGGNASVEIDAQVAARIGWLEQLVCKAGTREHESLLAIEVPPRIIHAAMLAAGLVPGSPGRWEEIPGEGGAPPSIALHPPRGDPVSLRARWTDATGAHDVALASWVRRVLPAPEDGGSDAVATDDSFPSNRFVFAGSLTRPNPKSLGPGEHYVADYTGSIVGLVTFGDEVIAFDEVIPDRVEFAAAEWEARTEVIPPEGTPVTLIVTRLTR